MYIVCVVTVVYVHVLQCEISMREYILNRTGLKDAESEPNLSDLTMDFINHSPEINTICLTRTSNRLIYQHKSVK